jgi:hypothetical protein
MTRLLRSRPAFSRPVFIRPVLGTFYLALGLSLGLSQGCAHSDPLQRSDAGSAASQQKLPFHANDDQASTSDGAHPAVSPDPNSPDSNSLDSKMTSGIPFGAHIRILPSGTLLTVKLENSLSAAKVRAGDAFLASIAAPLAIDGDSLIERGAAATGHVETVRSQADSGYFQLTLNAITLEGRPVALQTTSLFAKGTFQQSDGVRVQKGRRLTFRLTSPVTLGEPKSSARNQ